MISIQAVTLTSRCEGFLYLTVVPYPALTTAQCMWIHVLDGLWEQHLVMGRKSAVNQSIARLFEIIKSCLQEKRMREFDAA